MKLEKVATGQALKGKLTLAAIRVASGNRPPDVLRVVLYRPEFFGRSFHRCVQRLLRGASEFTVGERELFAAIVSRRNNCTFCYNGHRAVASRALGAELVDQILQDFRSAPVTPQIRASVEFLETLTSATSTVTSRDIAALRAAGVSDDGAEMLVNICYIFCIINRIADTLGFDVPSASAMGKAAEMMLKHGYFQV